MQFWYIVLLENGLYSEVVTKHGSTVSNSIDSRLRSHFIFYPIVPGSKVVPPYDFKASLYFKITNQ